ncbi:MAG: hypothetical protein WD423_04700 [Rhodothermales bacterium]
MHNLRSVSLHTLLKLSQRVNVVDRYELRVTVVHLVIDGCELYMSRADARFFLQGVLYGAAIKHRDERAGSPARERCHSQA